MPATYKSISETDIETIVALMQEFYAIDGYPMDTEKSKKLFGDFITDKNLGKAWLILDGAEIVGYVILTFVFSFEYGGKIAFVDELYIKDTARGKGLGRASIAFVQEEAAKLSLKLLYLEVEHHNAVAGKLYLAAGFSEHHRKLMRYTIK